MAVKGLDSWVKKLTKQNMPVVGEVISELNALTCRDDTELSQLTEVILRDANLTSHVLRISNGVHYNYSAGTINTVSRAIVLIGVKGMRAICISLLLIDSLLTKEPKERLLQLLARAFHAATQARALIKRQDESAAEEVFIAALLYHLGEMAFWAHEKTADEQSALLDPDPEVRKQAMEDVLGTTFKAITRALAKHWRLGETLEQALYPGNTPNPKVQAVLLGERMSVASLEGWESAAVNAVIEDMARYVYLEPEQCLALAKESAELSAEVALRFGAVSVCQYIPGRNTTKAEKEFTIATRKILKADPHLQLRILRELTTATAEAADINTIFQMVIEGMHRGIGLERVAIALIQQQRVKAKYAFGEQTETWRKVFDFDVGPHSNNIFTYAIREGGSHWLTPSFFERHPALYPPDIRRVIGCHPAFVSVMQVVERKVALFYADRVDFGGKLDKERFDSFRHFAAQAQLNLNVLSTKKSSQ